MGGLWRKAFLAALALATAAWPAVAQQAAPQVEPPKSAVAPQAARDDTITASAVRGPLEFLAADTLNGRASGSDGLLTAARYVAQEFKALGLAPGGPDGSYLVTFHRPQRRVDAKQTSMALLLPPERKLALALDKDFVPFRFSGEGKLAAEVVFCGYGITAPEHDYDDYAGVEAKGKVVLLLRYEPGDKDPQSKFDGLRHSRYATFESKIDNARKHGATGVVIFTGPHYHEAEGEEIYGYHASAGREAVELPALQITRPQALELFAACGKDLAKLQSQIDEKYEPQSFDMKGLRVEAAVALDKTPMELRNVVGLLRGSDEKLAAEAVVVGAHLDHVGRRAADPKDPQRDVIFNGADDNASGVAGVLAMARAVTRAGLKPKRTIVFCAFDGEEVGLLGSRYYVQHPALPLEKTAAMVNLDMIGRLATGGLAVYGTGTGTGLKDLVNQAGEELGLKPHLGESAMVASDGLPFAMSRVPSLFFHTGVHGDYHRVSDEAAKIDFAGLARVARAAGRVVLALADAESAPKYASVSPQTQPGGDGPMLGILLLPDDEGRLVIDSVLEGSGAEKAGLKPGDVVKSIDGHDLASFLDLAEIIRRHKAGDKVKVALARQGQDQTVEVTLSSRGQPGG